jgi:hypothetical protein
MGRNREDELDLADIGRQTDAATHGATIAELRPYPKQLGADLPAHRSSEQLPASANRPSCRAAVRGAATHRPDQTPPDHGRAVGGASASRNRRFEFVPLQRRVCKRSLPISRAGGHRDGPRRVADALCLNALMPLRETGAVSANLKAGVRRG